MPGAGAQIAKDKRFLYHPALCPSRRERAHTIRRACSLQWPPNWPLRTQYASPLCQAIRDPFRPAPGCPAAHAGDDFQARFTPDQVATLKAATGLDDRALRLALLPLAAACSVAPISRFFVGAIACGLSGTWYFGANMEFAGQGLFHSVHAEQSAISNAWLGGETGISEITVNYTPAATAASS